MVDINTIGVKLIRDTAIPIPAAMLVVYRADTLPDGSIAIRLTEVFSVIIER